MDVSRYQGIHQFGRNYAFMLENDTHALGSVDRVLAENMVRLCAETVEFLYIGYSPALATYEKGARPKLECFAADAGACHGTRKERIGRIAKFCHDLGARAPDELDKMLFGGTEEEIIARGSDWCTDVARVACALSQVSGVPARLVWLFNLSQAYSGHAIIEAFIEGVWGAVDPLNDILYRHADGRMATTWDLMHDEQLVLRSWKDSSSFYAESRQFGGAAVCNYPISCVSSFDYTVSLLNDYTRRILEMAAANWPGGLRWLQESW